MRQIRRTVVPLVGGSEMPVFAATSNVLKRVKGRKLLLLLSRLGRPAVHGAQEILAPPLSMRSTGNRHVVEIVRVRRARQTRQTAAVLASCFAVSGEDYGVDLLRRRRRKRSARETLSPMQQRAVTYDALIHGPRRPD